MIEISSMIAWKYSANFGHLRTFSENDGKCSYELQIVFVEFSEIFVKCSEISKPWNTRRQNLYPRAGM